jgi:L-ribulokinase
MTSVADQRYEPNPHAVAVYNELYGLYRELHDTFGGVPGPHADLSSFMKRLLAVRDRAHVRST